MRRVVSALLASNVLLVALAAPAAAQTPIDERRVREEIPLGALDFTLGPEFCGFPILVEDIDGKIIGVFITEDRHGNLLLRDIFHTITRYTNTDTGASFERRYDSVVNVLIRTDGTVRLAGRNDFFTWYPEGTSADLGPGVWLNDHGRIVEELDAEGNVVSADHQSGQVTDVCAALS